MSASGHIVGGVESRNLVEKRKMGPLKVKKDLVNGDPAVSVLAKDKEKDLVLMDTMLADGLTCAFNKYHMGITAENVAEKYSLTRAAQDEFALRSQQKAMAANDAGKFKNQIVAVNGLDTDEYINYKSSSEGLAKLKPAFKKEAGTVTAGNASGINDGAAFVLVMSEAKAKSLGAPILCYARGFASAGLDPKIMGEFTYL